MTLLTRRAVIVALSAASLSGCGSSGPIDVSSGLKSDLNSEGVQELARAFKAAFGEGGQSTAMRKLFKKGAPNFLRIQSAVREDFRDNRIFIHKGWHISHTEGQLYLLFANVAT